MKVIKSQAVTDSTLTATDVPENDYAAWAVGTTYADGDRVIVTTPNIHTIYESAQGSNVGNDPTTDDGTWWTVVSSTNRWKMFNNVIQEQTIQTDGIDVTLEQAQVVTALSAVNVDCQSIDVIMTDPIEGEIYNQNYPMVSYSGITNWYDYFFLAIERKSELVVIGLPPYASASINVVFNGSGDVKVGALVLGTALTIGDSQYGASFGIIDYSTKSVDAQGRTSIVEGTYSDEADIDVVIETGRFAQVKKILTDLRNVPTVWVASEEAEGTLIYGYYREFNVLYSGPTVSMCTLSIEGLT
jgi:hypothetical protein